MTRRVCYIQSIPSINGRRTTLYGLVGRGDRLNVKIGRRSFITVDSLNAFVKRLAER
jgi:hypothetical protein